MIQIRVIGGHHFVGNMRQSWDAGTGKTRNEAIMSINNQPYKSHNTGARWCVVIEIAVPLGNGRTRSILEFWRKCEAVEFINYFNNL